MSGHTPGPWEWRKRNNSNSFALLDPTGKAIADDGSAWGEYTRVIDPHGDDSRLIAAAPELLAALKDVLRSCRKDFAPTDEGTRAFLRAYSQQVAAIAKAEGRE